MISSGSVYGDENDPSAINRIRSTTNTNNAINTQKPSSSTNFATEKPKKSSLGGAVIANMKSIKDYFSSHENNNNNQQQQNTNNGGNVDDKAVRTSGTMFPAITGRDSRENSLAPMRISTDRLFDVAPSSGGCLSARSSVSSIVPPPPVTTATTSTATNNRINTRSQNKFEIYQDTKTAPSATTTTRPHSASTNHTAAMPTLVSKPTLSKSPYRATAKSRPSSSQSDTHNTNSGMKKRLGSNAATGAISNSTPGTLGVHINQIETELQNVHLDGAPGSRHTNNRSHNGNVVLSASKIRTSASEKTPTRNNNNNAITAAARNAKMAKHDNANTAIDSKRGSTHLTGGYDHGLTNNNNGNSSSRGQKVKRKSSDSEGHNSPTNSIGGSSSSNGSTHATAPITTAVLSTPADNAQRKKYSRTPGTLEAMHDMLVLSCPDNFDGVDDNLNNSYIVPGSGNAGSVPTNAITNTTTGPSHQINNNTNIQSNQMSSQAAHVWVVRYVDYTSKYGLGFLLNTGSVGVYFNDSTKIILSANGEIFQYFERKRQEGTGAGNHAVFEQITQTHSIHLYPIELQKKVTLLIHFRNYLTDETTQIDSTGKTSNPNMNNADGTNNGMEEIMKIRLPVDANMINAASASVKYGTNSATYIPSKHAVPLTSSVKSIKNDQNNILNTSVESPANSSSNCHHLSPNIGITATVDSEGNMEMIYLKKWVRTRHAILFRLSNRTVQVVFFDRSEVLLSSEARVITYVNKQGERSEHSLSDVLQTGMFLLLCWKLFILYIFVSTFL